MNNINVLVACEESQAVCKAFRELGFSAFSCDILECSGGHPEWHIQGDVLEVLSPEPKYDYNEYIVFKTMDGKEHWIEDKWDMIIAFPPCTFLSNAGACRLFPQKGKLNLDRYKKGLKGKEFFLKFYDADCKYIAVENPVPSSIYQLPKYSQTVQPYEHGHEYSKKTCLWTKNLPKPLPTHIVKPVCSWVSGGSKDGKGNQRKNCGMKFRDSRTKSKTFPGIAKAMAEQWGKYVWYQKYGGIK